MNFFLDDEPDSANKFTHTLRKNAKKLSDRFIPNRKASKLNIAFSNVHSDQMMQQQKHKCNENL